ncbi:MAG: hypothetical protein HYY76_16255 [Acidobacteria bacterium]|nr:hypothetical protein [Acidobacteriota bacterium]
MAEWLGRGFIPLFVLEPIKERFKLPGKVELLQMLQRENVVSHSQPRSIGPKRKSETCYILTPEGRSRLLGQ